MSAEIANLLVKMGVDASDLTKGLTEASKKIGQSMSEVGKNMSASLTLPIIGVGVAAVKMASDFEQSMANAASVSGATGAEFEKMKNVAREMGSTTAFSAKEAADAMYYMASAGWKANQMAEAIKPTLDLAAATQSDLAFTTDTVVATLNQFGLKAKDTGRVTNVFSAAIGNSQATLEKLSYSMRYVGPVANSLGYSVEQATAALSLLYNAGYKGEQAGTVLRGALSALLKPTKEVNQTLEEMGVSYSKVNPATNSLADIVKILGDKSITTSQAIQIFGQEAGPGMMALISQGNQALLDMEKKITGTDAAAEMAKRQLETFQGQLKILWSAISEVAIQIGNVLIPVLSDLVKKYISPAVQWFSNLSDGNKKLIVVVAGVVAAIGPLIFILGQLFISISAISTALPIVGAALGVLTGPVGLVIAAIAGLVAIIVHLWKTNEDFRNNVIEIWETIKEMAIAIFNALQGFWKKWGGSLTTYWTGLWKILYSIVSGILNNILNIISTGLNIIKNIFGFWANIFKGDWGAAWENVKNIGSAVWGFITKSLKNYTQTWSSIFEGFKTAALGVWSGIKEGLKSIVNAIIANVNTAINAFNSLTSIKVPSWVPGIGGKTIGIKIPNIPKLAEGGIVTGPTLALVGEGGESEVVAPLSKLSSITGNSGNRPIIIYLDGKKIYEGIDSHLGGRMVALGGT